MYAHLLHVGNHPDYLQNALDRDRLFDRLWLDAATYSAAAAGVAGRAGGPGRRRRAPLRNPATSTDLLHPGGERIEGFFATPGLDLVHARLRAMDEGDLERQGWLVQAAIEATRSLDERWT